MRLWLLLVAFDAACLLPVWWIVGGTWWMWLGASAFLASCAYGFGKAASR